MPGEKNIYHTGPVEPKVSVTLYCALDTPQPGRLPLPVLDGISGLEPDEAGAIAPTRSTRGGEGEGCAGLDFGYTYHPPALLSLCSGCTPLHPTTAPESR